MKTFRTSLVLLALATGAFAQDNNAAKLSLAHDVIAAMQADKMLDNMAAQMKQMALQTAAIPADATPEQRQKAEAFQGKVMDLTMAAAKDLITKMDQVYADIYSEAELRAIKAFFVSPEGQSMMAKQPQVMGRIMPLVQAMQRDLMPKFQQLAAEAKAAK